MNTSGQTVYDPQKNNKPVGPVIGLIVIIVIIILGGVYFWTSRTTTTPTETADQKVNIGSILEQSNSDGTASIEADLNNFDSSDIDNLDASLY